MVGPARIGRRREAVMAQRVGVFLAFGDLHFGVGIGRERGLEGTELIGDLAFGIGAFDAELPPF
jgi:hypothetical protein